MATEALFSIPQAGEVEAVTITFDGSAFTVPAAISVAAALLVSGVREFRSSVVGGGPRAPYCMMGVCFDCLAEIDGVPNRQACMVAVAPGMTIRRQHGKRAVEIE